MKIRRVKQYLCDKIRSVLMAEQGLSQEQSRVADIVFAFNNREMLKLLMKRGKYLSNANMDKAEAVEKEMTILKNQKFDELIVPNHFFCTFLES